MFFHAERPNRLQGIKFYIELRGADVIQSRQVPILVNSNVYKEESAVSKLPSGSEAPPSGGAVSHSFASPAAAGDAFFNGFKFRLAERAEMRYTARVCFRAR